ncbi:MAG: hypothetical protein AAF346_09520, partial [Pseudomonadota bacterium]
MLRLSLSGRARARVIAIVALRVWMTPSFASATVRSSAFWLTWFEIGGYKYCRDVDCTGTSGTNRG